MLNIINKETIILIAIGICVFYYIFIYNKKEHLNGTDITMIIAGTILVILTIMTSAVCIYGFDGTCLFTAFGDLFY